METNRPDPPERCPECGYALTGLPAAGRCPECGWALGEEAVVYFPSVFAEPGRWYDVTLLMNSAIMGVEAVSFFRGSQWVWSAFLGGSVLFMLYMLGKRIWLRRNGPAIAQARFGPGGFARREGYGPVRWRPWEGRHVPLLKPLKRPGNPPVPWFRLRIKGSGRLSVLRPTVLPFAMNFKLPAQEARALFRRVHAWRDAAVGDAVAENSAKAAGGGVG